ncbi:MAG: DUF6526 family protein [Vicinamibacterales bacterium]
MAAEQSYQHHGAIVPLFHYVLLPVLTLNILAMAYHLFQRPSAFTAWALVMALALMTTAFFARVFALKAQDRVIRLEERLRMRELLPAELKARIHEFTPEQLIGLRFASDAELPELAATVLRDRLEKRDAIKKLVKHWRADTFRV